MNTQNEYIETFAYDNRIVRNFMLATIVFAIVGMLAGLVIAFQLAYPQLNFGIPFTSFGRLRPVHTNAIIFAFVGNGIFMSIYYSLPRLCKTPMFSRRLGSIHFWGWQLIILLAAVTLLLGYTTGKEYAELEWPIDILITLVWVVFGLNMILTIIKRREKHMYVAIWFYLASFFAVAILHIVESIEIPVSLMKSYPVYAGVQDALVQWWYGHNAVAFFLTTPYLGAMYYFLPKAAQRPVYSYRLSIIHFWALIFIYIWAGPHHLLNTALPDWLQSLGVVFSLMLIAPSWGGMLNGLLTLRGAWDKVRTDPVLKFMVVAVTAYGMATFEGPMMSIKSVNALSHYTDWTIGHVHIGGMGWNGFLTFGILYWLAPRLYQTKLYSKKLANIHFWTATLGILVYAISMYSSGVIQGLMWKAFNVDGTLTYPNFLETVQQIHPLLVFRAVGGSLYLLGSLIGIYNLFATMKVGKLAIVTEASAPSQSTWKKQATEQGHRLLEGRIGVFSVLIVVALVIGGAVEIIPMFSVASNTPTIAAVKPYTPLELEGRDIYIREGCSVCHSQMIRPFRSETERYGEYSKPGEFVYDHPFVFGSKRIGPDLQRIGGKYPDGWHYQHLVAPNSTSPGSIMPPYPWLASHKLDSSLIKDKLKIMRNFGIPYTNTDIDQAPQTLREQAQVIADSLQKASITNAQPDTEIVALIAYLQRLGKDIKNQKQTR